MNGIMSGIEDRKNYSIGTESPSAGDRYKEIYDKYAQPAIDPLGKYLIQGSLQGFSENRGGSTLMNLIVRSKTKAIIKPPIIVLNNCFTFFCSIFYEFLLRKYIKYSRDVLSMCWAVVMCFVRFN